MKDPLNIQKFLNLLADESEKIITPLFNNPDLKIEWKADDTPVTYADKKSEEILRELIAKEFPSHGIIGEEFGNSNQDAEYTWVLDPIDGTRSFAAGSPLFGTLIAFCKNKQPLWSLINLSALNLRYIGNNNSTICNNRTVFIREPESLTKSFLLTTDPKSPESFQDKNGWEKLVRSVDQYRSWGDCFGYTLVASGGADIMCDPILNYWDLAALLPIVTGAGAKATDWKGNPTSSTTSSLVVSHSKIHNEIVNILNPKD